MPPIQPDPNDNDFYSSGEGPDETARAVKQLVRLVALLLPPIAAAQISLVFPVNSAIGFGVFLVTTLIAYLVTYQIMRYKGKRKQ